MNVQQLGVSPTLSPRGQAVAKGPVQEGPAGSLESFVKSAPAQDDGLVGLLRDRGQQFLSSAIQTVFDPNHSPVQAGAALADLRDLERAFKAAIDKTEAGQSENRSKLTARLRELEATGVSTGVLKSEETESLRNTSQSSPPGYLVAVKKPSDRIDDVSHSWVAGSQPIEQGQRFLGQEKVCGYQAPGTDLMDGVRHFVKDLHGFNDTLAGVLAVQQPLPLSPNTFATEHSNVTSQSDSSQETQNHQVDTKPVFLGFGRKNYTHNEKQTVSSHTTQTTRIDKEYSDVRVEAAQKANELSERLEQMKIIPSSFAVIQAQRDLKESMHVPGSFLRREKDVPLTFLIEGSKRPLEFSTDKKAFNYVGTCRADVNITQTAKVTRDVEQGEFQPAHISLPRTSLSHYAP